MVDNTSHATLETNPSQRSLIDAGLDTGISLENNTMNEWVQQ